MRRLIFPLVLLLVVVLAIIGCISDDGDKGPGVVRVTGSTTVFALAESCAETFNMAQDDYRVYVSGGGSGVGINNAGMGFSDIGMTSREIKDVERATYDTPEVKFHEFLVGYDGIAVVVSRAIHEMGIRDLTRDQVRAIYGGEIDNWKELDGLDQEIFVVGRRGGSGTRDTFSEFVMGSKEAEMPGVDTEAGDNSEVKTAVVASDWAIGYLGYSYVKGGALSTVALDGVDPSVEAIKDGSYELARKLYFYTYGDPTPGAQAFIDFVVSPEGQAIAVEVDYIPV